jgi:hypothetical protein
MAYRMLKGTLELQRRALKLNLYRQLKDFIVVKATQKHLRKMCAMHVKDVKLSISLGFLL